MWLLLALACDARQTLSFPVDAAPAQADGPWQLEEASVTFSDLRLHAPGEVAGLSLVPTAAAHPGHDRDGGATGELLGTFSLDLLGDEIPLGEASAWEGDVGTARLRVDAVTLAGTVDDVPFEFDLVFDDEIAGLPLAATLDADAPPSRLRLEVDPAALLGFADPETPDADEDGVLTPADGALGNTVRFGVLSVDAWRLTFDP